MLDSFTCKATNSVPMVILSDILKTMDTCWCTDDFEVERILETSVPFASQASTMEAMIIQLAKQLSMVLLLLECRHGDKMQKMTRGGESAFEELFQYACPKFITPAPPSLDAPSMNTNQVQETSRDLVRISLTF